MKKNFTNWYGNNEINFKNRTRKGRRDKVRGSNRETMRDRSVS